MDSSKCDLCPGPGDDGCRQPGKHAVSWLVCGFASVIIPGFLAMLAGVL